MMDWEQLTNQGKNERKRNNSYEVSTITASRNQNEQNYIGILEWNCACFAS